MLLRAHKQWEAWEEAVNVGRKKVETARIRLGTTLNEMRERIETGEEGQITWWDWYEAHFVRSRRDAERVMALALEADPVAAEIAKQAARREAYAVMKHMSDTAHNSDTMVSQQSTVCDITQNKPTKSNSSKETPHLKVVKTPVPQPIIRHDLINQWLADFANFNLEEKQFVWTQLRKLARQSWL
jgi:hypothetical protein